MELLLPLFYVLMLCMVIGRWRFFHDDQLPHLFFIGIFLLKIFFGILYIKMVPGGDAFSYYHDAYHVIYPALWNDPLKYFYLALGPNGGNIPQFILREVHTMGYWGDTSDYMVVRFNALACIFSFGNFQVHAVFMSFLSLVGLMWLYRSFKPVCNSSLPLVVAVFLIPSVLFWTSAVHKEGLLIFALGLFFYGCGSASVKWNVKSVFQVLAGGILVWVTRDFFFLLLLPGVVAFFFSINQSPWRMWSFPLLIAALLLAGSIFPIYGNKNFPEMIAFKQSQFKSLEEGATRIDIPDFEPNFSNLIKNLPAALRNSVTGPFFIEISSFVHFLVVAENALLLLALALSPFLFGMPAAKPMSLWAIVFSLSLLILIGYIVPNVGAIVRYRCLALPFLFLFFSTGAKR